MWANAHMDTLNGSMASKLTRPHPAPGETERNPLMTNPRTLATTFWGRADGLYCSPKCRQQAVRNRRKAAK